MKIYLEMRESRGRVLVAQGTSPSMLLSKYLEVIYYKLTL